MMASSSADAEVCRALHRVVPVAVEEWYRFSDGCAYRRCSPIGELPVRYSQDGTVVDFINRCIPVQAGFLGLGPKDPGVVLAWVVKQLNKDEGKLASFLSEVTKVLEAEVPLPTGAHVV